MCLADAMVASWSPSQETAGSSLFTVMTNIFVTGFSEFSEHLGKLHGNAAFLETCVFLKIK